VTADDAGAETDGDAVSGGAETASDDFGDGVEVSDVLPRPDDQLAEAVESALAGRSGVVAVGVPIRLVPAVLAARERSSGPAWRIACWPGAVDALSRALVLGTAVAESVERDEIRVRTGEPLGHGTGGTLFASPDRVDAVVGPRGDRTLATTAVGTDSVPGGSEAVDGARATAESRFDGASRATVEMPSRTRLLAAAREVLDDRFADDLAAVLDALDYGAVGRTVAPADRTLLVALAARHDHLFRDLRRWVDGAGGEGGEGDGAGGEGTEGDDAEGDADRVAIAPGQELTADRRALVERELIESIKVPMGAGRPKLRLRAVDEVLLRARPSEVLSVLRGRFALPLDGDGTLRRGPDGEGRRPVWDR